MVAVLLRLAMDSLDRPAVFWIISALLLVPVFPLSLGWKQWRAFSLTRAVALFVMSASVAHLFAAVVDNRVLGPDYSNVRFAVLGSWLALCGIATVASAVRGVGGGRVLLTFTGIWLMVDWIYLFAVSAVV